MHFLYRKFLDLHGPALQGRPPTLGPCPLSQPPFLVLMSKLYVAFLLHRKPCLVPEAFSVLCSMIRSLHDSGPSKPVFCSPLIWDSVWGPYMSPLGEPGHRYRTLGFYPMALKTWSPASWECPLGGLPTPRAQRRQDSTHHLARCPAPSFHCMHRLRERDSSPSSYPGQHPGGP